MKKQEPTSHHLPEDIEEQSAVAGGGISGFTLPLGMESPFSKSKKQWKKKKIKEYNTIGGLRLSSFVDFGFEDSIDNQDTEGRPVHGKKRSSDQEMMHSGDLPMPINIYTKYSILEEFDNFPGIKIVCDKKLEKDTENLIKDFVLFCQKYLKIKSFPKIYLFKEKHEGMTTGSYDLANNIINVLIGKRLVVDVLRTIAHELTHKMQHERGDLEEKLSEIDPTDEMGDIDTDFENEAYTLAGNLVKIYCRKQKILPKDELYSLNESKNLQERSKKFSAPVIMFHGTSSKYLPTILSQGLLAEPPGGRYRNQMSDEESGTLSTPSLRSVGGVYLTTELSTALQYADDTARATNEASVKTKEDFLNKKQDFKPVLVVAQMVPQMAFSDEDNLGIQNTAMGVIYPLNPWEMYAMEIYGQKKYQELESKFIEKYHKINKQSDQHPVDKSLLSDAFYAYWFRKLPYVEMEDRVDQFYSAMTAFIGKKKAEQEAIKLNYKVPEAPSRGEAEGFYKDVEDRLSRQYRNSHRETLRVTHNIGYTGRNKIIGVALIGSGGNYTWKYIDPAYTTEDMLNNLSENVLDKMGNKIATKNVRRGSVAGVVYMDKHDQNQKNTKQIMKKVSKNLNRVPYSHNPPRMGLTEILDYLLEEEDTLEERSKKFSKPIELYHGTSTEFLRSILSQGLIPDTAKGVWKDDPHVSIMQPSRISVGGTYLTPNATTAASYAYGSARKFNEQPIIVIVHIVPQALESDEDSIRTENSLVKAFSNITGMSFNYEPWKIKAIEDVNPTEYFRLEREFGNHFHERHLKNSKHKLDRSLLNYAFKKTWERMLPYVSTEEAKRQYHNTFVRFREDETIEIPPYSFLPPVPSKESVEKEYKAMEDKLTRHYKLIDTSDQFMTARTLQPIRFSGRNKIIGIIQVPKIGEDVAYVLYGEATPEFIDKFSSYQKIKVLKDKNDKILQQF